MSTAVHAMPARPVVHRETVPGGRYWSMIIRRGFQLCLVDVIGRANAALLAFNPHNPCERYNMADTLKGQYTYRLGRGHVLYSDMGRAMLSIVDDTLGWHDPIGGCTHAADIRQRHGRARYQEHRNDFHRNGRELFLIELAKWGLDERDLQTPVNFFSKVWSDEGGAMHYAAGHSRAGARVALRAEMDTLVVLNTAPHPLDPTAVYAPGRVEIRIERAAPLGDDDECLRSRPENARAFANTAIYHCQHDEQEAKT